MLLLLTWQMLLVLLVLLVLILAWRGHLTVTMRQWEPPQAVVESLLLVETLSVAVPYHPQQLWPRRGLQGALQCPRPPLDSCPQQPRQERSGRLPQGLLLLLLPLLWQQCFPHHHQ